MYKAQNHGWAIRYRKGGKTLCSLFPENDGFTVLLVLGKEESEKTLSTKDELSPRTRNTVKNTEQLRDGR